jgi:hypothetical protein
MSTLHLHDQRLGGKLSLLAVLTPKQIEKIGAYLRRIDI